MRALGAEYWYWLANGLGWGAVNTGELLDACPAGAEAVYQNLGSEALDAILTQKQAERLGATRPEDFALRIAHCAATGITVLGLDDARYPAALRAITNPPPVLFVKGEVALLNGQLAIGVVGARRPSAYGVEAVKAIGRGLALGGAIIVSGLAAGLDTEAHKAALAVNGPTIACIAFGHDHCYPAGNRKLLEIIERYGAVISEYPPDTTPEKPYFLQRNRIIAGFSHGLVVAEARRHSGTMSTVNFATEYGRDVFAVPGSIFSELSGGTNAMISEGAYVAASAGEILSVYGIQLPGEDPVAAAAKQAAEGRPEPAAKELPPWQKSLRRFEQNRAELADAAVKEQLPGQQTLNEILKAAKGQGQVSTAAAIESFRSLQGAGSSGNDRMLDEMASAVSDSVEIGRPPARRGGGKTKGQAEPYPWHQVEHLDKKEVAKQNAATAQSGRSPRRTAAARPPVSEKPVSRIEPIERLEPVAPISPVRRVQEIQALQEAAEIRAAQPARPAPAAQAAPQRRQPPAQPPPAFVPTPAAERPGASLKKDSGLAGRLKTLQKPEEQPAAKAAPAKPKAPEGITTAFTSRTPRDRTALLSETAKRALQQLGPMPADLAAICKRSGLSSAEAMAALTELELAGLSRQLAGRQFVITDQ